MPTESVRVRAATRKPLSCKETDRLLSLMLVVEALALAAFWLRHGWHD